MKALFTLLILLIPFVGFGQVSFNTSQILDVNNNSYSVNTDDDFVLDDNSNAHIIYKKDSHIFYNNNISGVFNNETFIDSSGNPYILIDSNDVIHIFLHKTNYIYDANWNFISASQELLYTNNSTGSFSSLLNVLPDSFLNTASLDLEIKIDYNNKIHLLSTKCDNPDFCFERDLYYSILDSNSFLNPILIDTNINSWNYALEIDFNDDVYIFSNFSNTGNWNDWEVGIWSGDYNQGFSYIQNFVSNLCGQSVQISSTLDNNGFVYYSYKVGSCAIYYGNNLNGSFSHQQISSSSMGGSTGGGNIGIDYGFSGIHIGYAANSSIEYFNNINNGSFGAPITVGSGWIGNNPTLRVDKFGSIHLFWLEINTSSSPWVRSVYYSKSNQIVDLSILGCTDSTGLNFNPLANTDDGSCIAVSLGCTDPLAFNYDINANTDDGSCIAISLGCTDSLANNYNPFANIDNETCLYSSFIFGCTDSSALNYNSLATFDDSSCCFNSDQIWAQIGQDIDGEAAGDDNGHSVSLSSDGNIFAVGANLNNGNGGDAGHVRMFENVGGSWFQIGQDIDGENFGDGFGTYISLSSDGNTVAIGAPFNDGNGEDAGHVRIYNWDGTFWSQIGQDIDGEAAGDRSGKSLSLSSDGNTVAIGALYNDGNGDNAGHVRIYENILGSWTQIGQDIDGEGAGYTSGFSVSLSSEGNILAIGANEYVGNGLNGGYTRIYENIGGSWSQIGQDIYGESPGDKSGYSVSLSSDGSIVAIGAPFNDGNGVNTGHVRVYENILGYWFQIGQDIDGEGVISGHEVSLSSNGNTIAIGAPSSEFDSSPGQTRIYKNIGGSWSQIGQDIDGVNAGDQSGWSVSLSSDGSIVAIGAINNDGNGNNAGHARIYEMTNPCLDLGCLDPLALNFDPFATADDSSCIYPLNGCTDPSAFNYDVNANTDDGSCIAVSLGCTDSLANNYNPFANIDNETCLYSSHIFGDSLTQFGNDVIKTNDQNFLIAGYNDNGENRDGFLAKINFNNEILWSKNIGGYNSDQFNSIIDDNGYYYMCGSTRSFSSDSVRDVFVVKTDYDGNIIWSKVFGGEGCAGPYCGDAGVKIIKESENQYVVVGNAASVGNNLIDAYIFKFDNNGELLYENTSDSGNGSNFYKCISKSSDGGLLIGGQNKAGTSWEPWLKKVDSNGNLIFTNTYGDASTIGNAAADLLEKNDSSFLLISNADGTDGLIKIDAFGDTIFSKQFTGIGCIEISFSLDSNSIYILGNYQSNINYLLKIDLEGNLIESSFFENLNSKKIITVENDLFVLSNPTFNTNGLSDISIFKIDSNFNNCFSVDVNNFNYQDYEVQITNKNDFYTDNNSQNSIVVSENVSNSLNSCVSCIKSDFEYLVNNETIELTNYSTPNISYVWKINDAIFSNEYNPSYEFNLNGIFDICLTSFDSCSSVTYCQTIDLNNCEFSDTSFTEITACESYEWNGQTYTESGEYSNTYTNLNGCDSTHTLYLIINQPDTSYNEVTACESYEWNGTSYTESGVYTNTSTNSNGCDSLLILNLTIHLTDTSFTDVTACDSYDWNGQTFDESGTYFHSIVSNSEYSMNFNGNNNYVSTANDIFNNLQIENGSVSCNINVFDTLSDHSIFSLEGYVEIAIRENNSTIAGDCISQSLILAVSDGTGICNSSDNVVSYPMNNINLNHWVNITITWENTNFIKMYINGLLVDTKTPINSPNIDALNRPITFGIHSSFLQNNYLNGLINNVHLWDVPLSSEQIQNYISCPPKGSEANLLGLWNFEEGEGNIVYDLSVNGNDGIIHGATYSTDVPDQACDLTTINGCDSVAVLNLTISQPDTSFTNITACESFEWNGETYSESGEYTNTYTNVNSCDSVAVLNLTITQPDTSYAEITACDSYEWNGETYTESGEYSNTYTNVNSCDSVAVLNLTITQPDTSFTEITACESYEWNGQTYTESGVYTNTYININGCDSIHTLNLTLNSSTVNIDTQIHCNDYTWIDGVTYNESNNSATYLLTDQYGCDSIVSLDLIISYSGGSIFVNACDSYEWNGETYTESGTYINSYLSNNGCISNDTLQLNIDICGCTDEEADNYDSNATFEDGSCIYCNSFSVLLIGVNDVSEIGGSDGQVLASGQGGSSNYNYNLYNSDGIPQNPFTLSAGTYTVEIIDYETFCIAYLDVEVNEPTLNFECSADGCIESSESENSFSSLEECELECSFIDPCDITPIGLYVDNIIHNRIRFNWSQPEVSPSHYMIRYREVGTNNWTVIAAGPQTPSPFNGTSRTRYFMEPETTYEWNIRARVLNEDLTINCQSDWSETSTYTTLPACANLENLSVSTEATWVTFFADAPDESWGVWQSKGKIREVGLNNYRYVNGDNSGNINGLKGNFTANTDYEWHTKAWCTGNVDVSGNSDPQYHSGWGEFSAFTTEELCDKLPINLSTSTNGANTSVIMSWDSPISGNPDHYFLEMTNNTSGAVYQWNNIPGADNSKTKFNQSPGDEISWRIRGACGTNGTSWATIFTQPIVYTLGGEKLQSLSLNSLEIYPNPSRDVFNIELSTENTQQIEIRVVNSIGQEIYREKVEVENMYTEQIDLSDYSKGMYNLTIKTNTETSNHRLILQ